MVVMRHMRPAGHFGLLFTQGLPWSIAAFLAHPTGAVALAFFGGYALCRVAMTWLTGIRGLKQPRFWREVPLIPVWDAIAAGIWLASFFRSTIRWRGADYFIRDGKLILARAD
jgi:ceramide glucosyltransferase